MIRSARSRARLLRHHASQMVLAMAAISALANTAEAQEAASGPALSDTVEEVVVTGYRASLQSALNLKRNSNVMVDAINAEDIADFPDANLAESLQRLPGVSIDRDNGEGRTITVRGLGSDFTRVRLNGLEALSTAGANDSGSQPNRSRGFDFNTFASELFSSLRVQKTASAETDEGSLGATIDLITGRPFNFKGRRLALSLEDAYYPNGKNHSPRVAGLVADRWDTGWGQFGATVSGAFNKRDQLTDSYLRQPGQSDYTYRGSTFAGTPNPRAGASTFTRQGFATPIGTACNAIVPGQNVTNAAACAAMTGSNPAAYALINSPIGSTLTNNGAGAFTSAPGSLIRIPALPTINQQDLHQERLGLTASVQWRSPDQRTTVSLDGVYSRFFNDSINYQVMVVGLNRNNTAANYNTASDATTLANKRGLYNTCVARAATPIQGAIDCGQELNGGALVAGTAFSYNPNNLEPYDYYNSPSSPGHVPISAANPFGLGLRDAMIGRPSVKLIDAALSPTGANADYLKLGNVDVRSAADQQYYTTFFQQGGVTIEHAFTDRFRMNLVAGQSRSYNKSTGLLADFIRLDSGQGVTGNDYLVYDARGDGGMPLLDLGFDAADPANWDFVKNYSQLVVYHRYSDNRYKGGRIDFAYDLDDDFTVKFGFSKRQYRFDTSMSARTINATLNPSLIEAGTNVGDMSKPITFGKGLDMPAGTATTFLAPDMGKFLSTFDFNCNCINKWGDYRTTIFANAANTYGVVEEDTGGFVQFDFDRDLFGRALRGNLGVRYAVTDLETSGLTNTARPISATNHYADVLPSINLAYEVADNMLVRFGAADVMARPLLGNLAPSVTSFSVPSDVGATTGGSITVGNPKLNPFRATNYDLSFEWYFTQGALVSVAVFDKAVHSFPQTITSSSTLTALLDPAVISQLRASQTNVNSLAYIDADNPFDVRQFRDAPGGYIRGVEISYQQNLTFLPWFLKNLGVQANYTHLESELQYILDPGAAETRTTPARPRKVAGAPFTGASPDSFNFTLYYDARKWSARVSTAYRAKYFTQYPVASGTCDPGVCDSPLVNDFVGSKATTNVDASFSYKFNPNFSLKAEALNLTNQRSERFAYDQDPVVTSYAAPGRQFFVGVRFIY